jgi:alkylated DNA repair dioxygenase AlkB
MSSSCAAGPSARSFLPIAMLSFANEPQTLLDSELGVVRYFPNCIAQEVAAEAFEILLAEVSWESHRRQMYDREVDVPRLTAMFDLNADNVPNPIASVRGIVETLSGHAFNSAGLNLYRNGHDSVAPHNDKLHTLAKGAPIALLSLGATRRFTLRTKEQPKRHLDLDLESGSLLMMSYETQLHLDHGVPKTKQAVGPRISVVYRDRPEGFRDRYSFHEKK